MEVVPKTERLKFIFVSLQKDKTTGNCSEMVWRAGIIMLYEFVATSTVPDFPGGSNGKASAYNAGDLGSIPRLGRSPGEGNGNPLQYSCLENPTAGRARQATVHGVAKSWTRLSEFTHSLIQKRKLGTVPCLGVCD